jgi:hypothetical protein
MPESDNDRNLELTRLQMSLRNPPRPVADKIASEQLLEVLGGALSCPHLLCKSPPWALESAGVAHVLVLQMRIVRTEGTSYESSLASMRISKIVEEVLRTPSLHALNAVLIFDRSSIMEYWTRAAVDPAFAGLLNIIYQASKIWGWSLPALPTIWDILRQWQWSSLWVPATNVILTK